MKSEQLNLQRIHESKCFLNNGLFDLLVDRMQNNRERFNSFGSISGPRHESYAKELAVTNIVTMELHQVMKEPIGIPLGSLTL